jgi:hypothetical protein
MPSPDDAHDHADPPGLPGRRRHQPAAIDRLNALIGLIEDAYAQHAIDDAGRKKLYAPYLRLRQQHGRSAFQLDDPVGLIDLAEANRTVQRTFLELAPGFAAQLRTLGPRPSR